MSSTTTAFERLADALRDRGSTVRDTGHGQAQAQCPAHDDGRASLSLTRIDGSALVYCHAGCPISDVLGALNLGMADLYDDRKGSRYDYPDGRRVFRSADKRFWQAGNTKGRSLFRADRIGGAETVYVVEGEKDVLAIESVGGVAVCPAMGAGKADKFDWAPLRAKHVIVVADRDDAGRRHAAQVAALLRGIAATVRVVEAAAGKDAADHIAAGHSIDELVDVPAGESSRDAGRKLVVTRGNEVKPKRINWVVQDWIPENALVLLAGREGLGKSTIACDMAARITCGTLDGTLYGSPRNVLYVHSEDSREHTVAPRLAAAGADMSKVLFVDVQTDYCDHSTLALPLDLVAFEQVISEHKVAFVVLDAATSAMHSALSGRDDRQVREYLEPLAAIADRQQSVILGIVHFGKRDSADTGKLILGSIAWSQVPRSVLSVATDDETGHLLITNTKRNLAPRQRSMEAVIETTTITVDDGSTEVGALRWLGESDRDVTDLLAGGIADNDERNAAQHWLEDYLTENGPTPSKDIKAAAAKEKISEATLKRAKKKLGVVDRSMGFPRTSTWYLPSQLTAHSADPTREPTEPTEPTEDDQHKQREPTGAESQSAHPLVCEPTGEPTGLPSCRVCGQPMLCGQAETHLGCRQQTPNLFGGTAEKSAS